SLRNVSAAGARRDCQSAQHGHGRHAQAATGDHPCRAAQAAVASVHRQTASLFRNGFRADADIATRRPPCRQPEHRAGPDRGARFHNGADARRCLRGRWLRQSRDRGRRRAVVPPCRGTGLGEQSAGRSGAMMMRRFNRRSVLAAACLAAPTLLVGPQASAQEKLRVGKAVAEAFAFLPLDVGVREGIFKRHGLDVEITSFGGGARLQQALAADSIDIGVSAGPELALLERGAPVKGVAMPFGPPVYLMLLVRPDGPVKSAADLKGRKIGVSSARSLTGWLAVELSRAHGWGARGIELVGSPPRTSLASIKTGQIDGMVT